jgi:hypothetical protein
MKWGGYGGKPSLKILLLLAAIVCVSVSATRSCLKFCNITFQQTSATAGRAHIRHDTLSTRYYNVKQNEINAHINAGETGLAKK